LSVKIWVGNLSLSSTFGRLSRGRTLVILRLVTTPRTTQYTMKGVMKKRANEYNCNFTSYCAPTVSPPSWALDNDTTLARPALHSLAAYAGCAAPPVTSTVGAGHFRWAGLGGDRSFLGVPCQPPLGAASPSALALS